MFKWLKTKLTLLKSSLPLDDQRKLARVKNEYQEPASAQLVRRRQLKTDRVALLIAIATALFGTSGYLFLDGYFTSFGISPIEIQFSINVIALHSITVIHQLFPELAVVSALLFALGLFFLKGKIDLGSLIETALFCLVFSLSLSTARSSDIGKRYAERTLDTLRVFIPSPSQQLELQKYKIEPRDVLLYKVVNSSNRSYVVAKPYTSESEKPWLLEMDLSGKIVSVLKLD